MQVGSADVRFGQNMTCESELAYSSIYFLEGLGWVDANGPWFEGVTQDVKILQGSF